MSEAAVTRGLWGPCNDIGAIGFLIQGKGGIMRFLSKIFCCRNNPVIWTDKLMFSRRFKVVLDMEAVLDRETGLIWERSPDQSNLMNWEAAIRYCQNVTIGGRKGWRLPTVEEILSLVDPSQSNPALPEQHPFVAVVSHDYLTATTVMRNSGQQQDIVVTVGIGDAHTGQENKNQDGFVWCVRGGNGVF